MPDFFVFINIFNLIMENFKDVIRFSWEEDIHPSRERIGAMYCFKLCENWKN